MFFRLSTLSLIVYFLIVKISELTNHYLMSKFDLEIIAASSVKEVFQWQYIGTIISVLFLLTLLIIWIALAIKGKNNALTFVSGAIMFFVVADHVVTNYVLVVEVPVSIGGSSVFGY